MTPKRAPASPEVAQRAAEELATSLKDDIVCDQKVRSLELSHDGEGAWQLMLACAAQGKWSNLRQFLRLHRVDGNPGAFDMRLLGHVLALRGGEFGADLPTCRELHWPIHTLGDTLSTPPPPVGQWIIFRAHASAELALSSGVRTVDLREEVRGSQDVNAYALLYHRPSRTLAALDLGRARSEDFFSASGVVVTGELAPGVAPLATDAAHIVLAEYLGYVAGRTEGTPRLRVVAAFKPGISGF